MGSSIAIWYFLSVFNVLNLALHLSCIMEFTIFAYYAGIVSTHFEASSWQFGPSCDHVTLEEQHGFLQNLWDRNNKGLVQSYFPYPQPWKFPDHLLLSATLLDSYWAASRRFLHQVYYVPGSTFMALPILVKSALCPVRSGSNSTNMLSISFSKFVNDNVSTGTEYKGATLLVIEKIPWKQMAVNISPKRASVVHWSTIPSQIRTYESLVAQWVG